MHEHVQVKTCVLRRSIIILEFPAGNKIGLTQLDLESYLLASFETIIPWRSSVELARPQGLVPWKEHVGVQYKFRCLTRLTRLTVWFDPIPGMTQLKALQTKISTRIKFDAASFLPELLVNGEPPSTAAFGFGLIAGL